MAERYEVGRGYTKRQRIRATIDPDGMRAVMDALAANYPDVQGRIADLERRAAAHLKNANMPLDLRSPIYGNPPWLRENERKSLDWYAFSILNPSGCCESRASGASCGTRWTSRLILAFWLQKRR